MILFKMRQEHLQKYAKQKPYTNHEIKACEIATSNYPIAGDTKKRQKKQCKCVLMNIPFIHAAEIFLI